MSDNVEQNHIRKQKLSNRKTEPLEVMAFIKANPKMTTREVADHFKLAPITVTKWITKHRKEHPGDIPWKNRHDILGDKAAFYKKLETTEEPVVDTGEDIAIITERAIRLRMLRLASPLMVMQESSRDMRQVIRDIAETFKVIKDDIIPHQKTELDEINAETLASLATDIALLPESIRTLLLGSK